MTQEFAQAPVVGCKRVAKTDNAGSHAKVYFTKHIDAEHLIKLYDLINESIYGKIAIKLHTGEKHGPNILPREMVIHRMTGDGAKRSLIAPLWSADKKRVLNAINRRFLSDNLEQGSALVDGDVS